jgi:hypothetical protein
VKLNTRRPSDAERCESVVVLQAPELALDVCASTVEPLFRERHLELIAVADAAALATGRA